MWGELQRVWNCLSMKFKAGHGKRYQSKQAPDYGGRKWQAKEFLLYAVNDKEPLEAFQQRSDKIIIVRSVIQVWDAGWVPRGKRTE